MSICKLCGKEAGFLRTVHKECDENYHMGRAIYEVKVANWVQVPKDILALRAQLAEIARKSFISPQEEKSYQISGWQIAAQKAMADNLLTQEEESALANAATALSLTQNDLVGQDPKQTGPYYRVVKGAVLRELLHGNLPKKIAVEGGLPFILQKGETLIWLFPGTGYYEQRTRTHYEGGSSRVSFRVAKGVYYHTSAFRGNPVQTTELVAIGYGTMGITDKNIYYSCTTKTFRIKLDKIISLTPYSDGIALQRDTQSAKPQVFVTGDGWFLYNLITNLTSIESQD
ncbi:MAG: hypothetical protein LLG44_05735 [Chloroflexi bacterium]|nr:hypothetical protein [Chloroflexota bacterium]